jgi:hypothetical protein
MNRTTAVTSDEPAALRPEGQLASARLLGRLEAESFEGALREQERCEREERLTRLAAGDEAAFEPAGGLAAESSGAAWRLQQEVDRLAAFHHAVVHSRAWRLIQAGRRLFGRAW